MLVKWVNLRLNSVRATLVLAGTLSVLMGFQNCSQAKFSQASGASSGVGTNGYDDVWRDNLDQPNTNPGSCYTILQQIATDTKLIFVVDNSGSNVENPNGSDPNKQLRGGSIQAFFDDFKDKQNFWWGFVSFKGSTATALINDNMGNAIFSNTLPPMQSAISTFMSSVDSGNTPYQAAISKAQGAISSDTAVNANTKWLIVFLSDGKPNPSMTDDQLKAAVTSIVGAKPNKVSFNTIYYGKTDVEAADRLRLMAQTGGGKFLDTNVNPSGKSFLIANVVNVPGMPNCQP